MRRHFNPSAIAKSERIDLGLAISGATLGTNERRSFRDIAAFCDCSKALIQKIEANALLKCRKRLQEAGFEL